MDFGVARARATRQVVKFSRRRRARAIGGFSRFVSSISLDDARAYLGGRSLREPDRSIDRHGCGPQLLRCLSPSGSRHVRVDGFDDHFPSQLIRIATVTAPAMLGQRTVSRRGQFGAVRLRACAGGVSSFRASPGRSAPSAPRCLGRVLLDSVALGTPQMERSYRYFRISDVRDDEFVAEDTDYVATFDLDLTRCCLARAMGYHLERARRAPLRL